MSKLLKNKNDLYVFCFNFISRSFFQWLRSTVDILLMEKFVKLKVSWVFPAIEKHWCKLMFCLTLRYTRYKQTLDLLMIDFHCPKIWGEKKAENSIERHLNLDEWRIDTKMGGRNATYNFETKTLRKILQSFQMFLKSSTKKCGSKMLIRQCKTLSFWQVPLTKWVIDWMKCRIVISFCFRL